MFGLPLPHLKSLCFSFITLSALYFLACLPASAQTELTAGVRGVVTTKTTGGAVPGASLVVINERFQLRREARADEHGQFRIFGLPPGSEYEISVTADGFRPLARHQVTLGSGEVLVVEAALELSGITDAVTVVGTEPLVVSTAPEVSQAVDARRVAELPSNGRSLNRFALLDPHVRNTGGLGSDGSTAARLSINANSFRHTYYKLDGNSNYDTVFANAPQQQVSLSAVAEFKVLTNQYSAEYGGSAAGIVSAVTKAGTDRDHGEGLFFLRPSGIQAAPPVSSLHVPNELRQFGGTFSGPLFGSATFFVNYERTQQDRGAFIQKPAPLTYIGHLRDQMGLARVDYTLNDSHSLALRLNGNRSTNDNANDRVSGFTQPSAAQLSRGQGVGGQLTDRTAWGKFVNELRLSYTNALPSATSAASPQVSVVRPNYSTEGGSTYSWVRTESWQLADTLSVARGGHDLKAGLDYTRQQVRDFSVTPFGEYRLAVGQLAPGPKTEYTQTFGVGFLRYGQTLASAFVQDNWRVTPRLTANLGLRYDYQSITNDRNNFSPRLGFAFDVAGDGKTVVRGGAGVFYDQYYMYITRRFLLQGVNAPTTTYKFLFGQPGFPAFPESLTAPPSGATPLTRDFIYLPGERLLNPYNLQFSLGVQRTLFKDWTITLDALHSRTLKQMRVRDLNAPAPFIRTAPGQSRSAAAADATRPFQTYAGVPVTKVSVVENTSSSNYDALDLGLVRRFARRFQLEAHYVYASAMTYAMFFGEPDTGVPSDWRVSDRLEYGPSDFHQRHRFVAHSLIELPFKSQVSFVATLASGLPVNPVTGDDTNGDGYKADRPVGFGRNSFRTPMQASVDTSLAKRFALREGVQLELRAEAFNLFNRSNFIKLNNIYGNDAAPKATFLSPLAGIANADPARQFQFAVRLVF